MLFCIFSERLSIAYITNPWAPVDETTGPHRVTMKKIKNLERTLKCFSNGRRGVDEGVEDIYVHINV